MGMDPRHNHIAMCTRNRSWGMAALVNGSTSANACVTRTVQFHTLTLDLWGGTATTSPLGIYMLHL